MCCSRPLLRGCGNVLDLVSLAAISAGMKGKSLLFAAIALATAFCGKKSQAPAPVTAPPNQGVVYKEVDRYRTSTKTSTVMRSGPGKNYDPVTCKIMSESGESQPAKTLPPKYIVEVVGRSEKQDTIENTTDHWMAILPLGVESGYMGAGNCNQTVWVFGGLLTK